MTYSQACKALASASTIATSPLVKHQADRSLHCTKTLFQIFTRPLVNRAPQPTPIHTSTPCKRAISSTLCVPVKFTSMALMGCSSPTADSTAARCSTRVTPWVTTTSSSCYRLVTSAYTNGPDLRAKRTKIARQV